MFADEPHLLAVVLVSGKTMHLVSQRRACPPPCRGLAKRRTHGFRVGHATRSDDLERIGRGIVKADM